MPKFIIKFVDDIEMNIFQVFHAGKAYKFEKSVEDETLFVLDCELDELTDILNQTHEKVDFLLEF